MESIKLDCYDPKAGTYQTFAVEPPLTIGRSPGNTIVLDESDSISRQHAHIEMVGSKIIIFDNSSRNGVLHNGERVDRAVLDDGDEFQIGRYIFTLRLGHTAPPPEATVLDDQSTIYLDDDVEAVINTPRGREIAFPPDSFRHEIVPIHELDASGLPIEETTYLTIGGGLGSFVWVDHLVIYGVDPQQIKAIGFEAKPYGRYKRLCANSQIPGHERLRSDSGSTPDNIWGWPGYGVREILQTVGSGQLGTAAQIGWKIFGEPTLATTYTPKSDNVYVSIDREADRIGWDRIWRFGRVRAIRKTDDGRYVIAYSGNSRSGDDNHRLMIATYVHLSVGYPALRFLPDLQRYREITGDFKHVVNAYEMHDEVYADLERNGGTVMIRGRGIVASRIIQRLYEARQRNVNIGIVHLMRTPLTEGYRYGLARRRIESHWEFQPFNWPKAAWSGSLRSKLENASDQQRSQLLDQWGGTTTADREDWRKIVEDGQREGWYRIAFGEVEKVDQQESGQIVTSVCGNAHQPMFTLVTDYVIDCTGLVSSLDSNPLLADLLNHYQLERNGKGRFFVTNDFEIPGMQNRKGRMYAAGVITLGGPYAAVDSFLGLQYAAYRSVNHLKKLDARGLRGLNTFRSISQYVRWIGGVAP